MPLLGPAAVVISFDIEPSAIDEHDDWHSREHMPERLSVPGFLRGSRWRSVGGSPGYLVLYEVAGTDVLTSAAYLQRLNQPTPWTAKMMKCYRDMARSLCRVTASVGQGLGGSAVLVRTAAAEGQDERLRQLLACDVLPRIAAQRGVIAAHLLESAVPAAMTTEQRIRGNDADLRFTLLATGFDANEIAGLLAGELKRERLRAQGAADAPFVSGTYRLAAVLTANDQLTAA